MLTNFLTHILVFAAMVGVAYLAISGLQKIMDKNTSDMSKRFGNKVQAHPYMEIIPTRVGQTGGRESEIVPAPDADLSREEPEDPRRA